MIREISVSDPHIKPVIPTALGREEIAAVATTHLAWPKLIRLPPELRMITSHADECSVTSLGLSRTRNDKERVADLKNCPRPLKPPQF